MAVIKIKTLQEYRKSIAELCDSKQFGGNNNKNVDPGQEKRNYDRAVASWNGETFEFNGAKYDADGSLFDSSKQEKFNFQQNEQQDLFLSPYGYSETYPGTSYYKGNGIVSKGFSNKYDAKIEQYANKYGIDPNRVKALIMNESGFNPNAVSSTRDYGLMQLNSRYFKGNLTDVDNNLEQGCKYFAQCLNTFGGDYDKALLAYNRGIGGAKSYLKSHRASDATYVQRVNGFYNQLNQNKNLRITA